MTGQDERVRRPPAIMGVLNVTPDSFSDGGAFLEPGRAVSWGRQMLEDGADILDIGGESTGPGSTPLGAEEELERIERIVAELAPACILSIDTYKHTVAERCLALGARMLNDVSGLRADPALAEVAASYDADLVLMYAKDGPLPHVSKRETASEDIIEEISRFFERQIEVARRGGVADARIILDPGMGAFLSRAPEASWIVLERLEVLKERFKPFRFLIGTSRKGFLGGALKDRDPASQLTALIAYTKGAEFIRTHNPAMMREFVAIWRRLKE